MKDENNRKTPGKNKQTKKEKELHTLNIRQVHSAKSIKGDTGPFKY